jgi:glycosyltransferase involved in cell wall biosynthesis
MNLVARWRWESTVLIKACRDFRPDWIWALGNYGFASPPCSQSILLHDPHVVYPVSEFGDVGVLYRAKKTLLKHTIRRCLANTSRVYCQTDTIRHRFHKQFRYPLDQIAMCPPAYSLPQIDADGLTIPPLLEVDYSGRFRLLYVSTCSAHKNHRTVVDTFGQYHDQLEDVVCFFTIDGDENDLAVSIMKDIRASGLNGQLVPIGHLPPEQVVSCYQKADALLFPSLLETAGLPLVEAMCHGLPIIASDRDFAHEICGDAARYFDPRSEAGIRDAILHVKNDPGYRRHLSERGRERFARHIVSWESVLQNVLEIEQFTCSGCSAD